MLLLLLLACTTGFAQQEGANPIDSLLHRQKGLLGKLAQTLMADTADEEARDLQRADLPFQKYRNRIIRTIHIAESRFGVVLGDTSRRVNGTLSRVANFLHVNTHPSVVRNYLFFRENDRVSPFLLGNNERFLRDQAFLLDATIRVRPVRRSKDSVDVYIQTNDVLSIGGGVTMGTNGTRLSVKEDNFMGWGDRLEVQTLYDRRRFNNFGFGAQYTRRNVAGSFIDASLGYLNFNPSLSTRLREEQVAFLRLVKPLVNPYMKWTYAVNAELHSSSNMFNTDSVYQKNFQYRYRIYDAWAGWNPVAFDTKSAREYERLRFLLSARLLSQRFLHRPKEYEDRYFFPFADVTALLASITVFRLNFYKTQYIYGFGRNEDLPEGVEASFTTGIVNRAGRRRHYMGLSVEATYLTSREQYFDYAVRLGTSVRQGKWEDVTLLASVDYFSPLYQLGNSWKQRNFFGASFGTRINPLLDEPFYVESVHGLPAFQNNFAPGNRRATIKGESVFYSPWSLLYFRFAPFVFGSATLFRHDEETFQGTRLYAALGGGVRTRNESLVFGTVELRGSYFPRKDFWGNGYLVQVNTNIRFKYNQNFIRRPELLVVN
jgi:hypothetical protein